MRSISVRRWLLVAGAASAMPLVAPRGVAAQTPATPATPAPRPVAARAGRALSLDEALTTAARKSEAVRIASAGIRRARGQQDQARSLFLPQLNATLGYQRAIQNQFQEISESAPADTGAPPPPALCAPRIPEGATPEERAAALAQATSCPDAGSGFGAITSIFASPNTVTLGITGSQTLFAGGRVIARNRAARAGRRSAEVGLTAAQAQVKLDVTQAYFDAALADRLVTIAESSLVQTERTFRRTTLSRQVGSTSEFDLLRARVARDNQRPQLIQARTSRDMAYVRLRQLLDLPLDEPLQLTTSIQDEAPPAAQQLTAAERPGGAAAPATPVARVNDGKVDEALGEDPAAVAAVDSAIAAADTSAEARAAVRQARENVEAQRNLLRATRAQRLPALSLSTNYQRFAYPSNLSDSFRNLYPNWTVSLGVSVPLITGGRIHGEVLVAEANVAEAEEQLQQAREFAALDAQLAVAELEQAQSSYFASQGTAGQAQRAFTIAEVRYTEGLSTQLELSEARLLFQRSEVQRARAARDLQVARVRLALLRDLPIAQPGSAAQQQLQQQQQQQDAQPIQPQGQGSSAGGFSQTSTSGGGPD
jgi:outer membrane protein